jgi:phenylalanyl-tRNA synthetase alpha subunit
MDPSQLISNMNDQLSSALQKVAGASDLQALYDIKVAFAGKQGFLSEIMREMGKLPKEDKPAFGKEVNRVKEAFEQAYVAREEALKNASLLEKVKKDAIDVSLPGPALTGGAKHPIALVMDEVIQVLSRLGYTVRTGPQIEKDWYNFEALNIPPDHPARDMQDTFYIDADHVLHAHFADSDSYSADRKAAVPRAGAGVGVPQGLGYFALSEFSSDRRAAGRQKRVDGRLERHDRLLVARAVRLER